METLDGLNRGSEKTVDSAIKTISLSVPHVSLYTTTQIVFEMKTIKMNLELGFLCKKCRRSLHHLLARRTEYFSFACEWQMAEHIRALLLLRFLGRGGTAASRLPRKWWVSFNNSTGTRTQAIWGETSKASRCSEEKEQVYSVRDDGGRNKQAVLLDATVYCTQNAVFPWIWVWSNKRNSPTEKAVVWELK